MRLVVTVLAAISCGLCFSQPALAQQTDAGVAVAEQSADTLVFLEGLNLFYSNDHAGASNKFLEYQASHSISIVALRLLYNRYVGVFDKLSPAARKKLLDDAGAAIKQYETGGCNPEILAAIAGGSIDCAYVGAALYSFRSGLYAKDSSWHEALGDRAEFLKLAARSSSPQSIFLLGMAEYEVSIQSRWKRFGANLAGVASSKDRALSRVMDSLNGNTSPFVDDAWFFIFDVERTYLRRKRRTGHHDEAVEGLLARYPFAKVVGYLASKYPENRKLVAAETLLSPHP